MKNKISCKTCSTVNCFIRENLSAEWIDKVDTAKQQLFYENGQYIFKQGWPVEGMYFIMYGNVKVLTTGFKGNDQIVRLATDGHILGHRGLGNEVYPVSAKVIKDTLVCFVDNVTLSKSFIHNPKFPYALMMFYSRELRKMELRMMYLGHMNVREKIAEALLYINVIFGTNTDDGTLNTDSFRQVIAKLSATNTDQVTKQIKDFENEKLVLRIRRRIKLINTNGLEKIVHHFGTNELLKQH